MVGVGVSLGLAMRSWLASNGFYVVFASVPDLTSTSGRL